MTWNDTLTSIIYITWEILVVQPSGRSQIMKSVDLLPLMLKESEMIHQYTSRAFAVPFPKLSFSTTKWEGRDLIWEYSCTLCKKTLLLLILLTPSLSPVGTGHNAVAHYHSPPPPVTKLHCSLQPHWAWQSKESAACVCVRQPRWKCDAVTGQA